MYIYYYCFTFMHLFPMFQLLYCLAHLHSFIYLLMWHFVILNMSILYIYRPYRTIMVFFKQPFHYIILITVLYDYYYFGSCRASGYV